MGTGSGTHCDYIDNISLSFGFGSGLWLGLRFVKSLHFINLWQILKGVEFLGHSSTDVPCYSKKTEKRSQDENVAVLSEKINKTNCKTGRESRANNVCDV